MLLLFFSLIGCSGKIKSLYEQEKSNALLVLTEAPDDWKPDLRLRIAYSTINDLGKEALNTKLKKVKINHKILRSEVALVFKNEVQSFRIQDTPDESFGFKTRIKGTLDLDTLILKKTIPYSLSFEGDVEIFEKDGSILGRLQSAKKLSLKTQEIPNLDLSGILEGWFKENIPKTKPFELTKLDLQNLQLRAINIDSNTKSADINMLSNVNGSRPIPRPDTKIKSDWELQLSQSLLKGWARRAAFKKGILQHGIAIDPKNIQLENQDFSMDLRLWKLEGGQWWRDYSITGDIDIKDKKLHLQGKEVKEIAESNWAGLADPLALLAEGFILDTIKEQINYAIPSQHSTNLQGRKLKAVLKNVRGENRHLSLYGSFEEESKKGKKAPKRKGSIF